MNELREEIELPAITQHAMGKSACGDYAWALTEREDQLKAAVAVNKEKEEVVLVLRKSLLEALAGWSDEAGRAFEAEAANREQKAEIERLNHRLRRANLAFVLSDAVLPTDFETELPPTKRLHTYISKLESELASLRASVGEKWIEIKPDTVLTDQMEVGRWMGPKWVICRLECGRDGWEMIYPNDFYTHYRLLAPPTLPGEEE